MTGEAGSRRGADPERRALTAFCAALPGLHAQATRGFWVDTLEMHVAEVAEGGSAVAACRELELDLDATTGPTVRSGEPGVDGAAVDWLPAPTLVGDYSCPLRRCARRADRDDQARPPRCAVAGRQMRFVRQDPAG